MCHHGQAYVESSMARYVACQLIIESTFFRFCHVILIIHARRSFEHFIFFVSERTIQHYISLTSTATATYI